MGWELGTPGGKALHGTEPQDRVLRRGWPFRLRRDRPVRGQRGQPWAGTMTGLWRWKPGPPKVYPMPDPANRINALIETDDGGILVTKDSGIAKLKNGKTEIVPLAAGLEFQPGELLRDRHGALWIGAMVDSGLLPIHEGRSDLFTRSDALGQHGPSSPRGS